MFTPWFIRNNHSLFDLPPIDLNQPFSSIKTYICHYLRKNFEANFNQFDPCSFHYLCICSNCYPKNQTTNFVMNTADSDWCELIYCLLTWLTIIYNFRLLALQVASRPSVFFAVKYVESVTIIKFTVICHSSLLFPGWKERSNQYITNPN